MTDGKGAMGRDGAVDPFLMTPVPCRHVKTPRLKSLRFHHAPPVWIHSHVSLTGLIGLARQNPDSQVIAIIEMSSSLFSLCSHSLCRCQNVAR